MSSEPHTLPRSLTPIPLALATTISLCSGPRGSTSPMGKPLPLDPSLHPRDPAFLAVERAPSPHQTHLLGSCPGGNRDSYPLGVRVSMGALFPRGPEQDQGGTGQRLGMSQVSHRPALSSSSFLAWPPPSRPHLDHRPSLGPLHRLLLSPGALQLLPRWGSGWPRAVLREQGGPLHDSALGTGPLPQPCLINLSGRGTPVQEHPVWSLP